MNTKTRKPKMIAVSDMRKLRDEGFRELCRDIHNWKCDTFPDVDTSGQLRHLRSEVEELIDDPENGAEMADIMILLIGHAEDMDIDILEEVRSKMEINKRRTWGRQNSEGYYQHTNEE